MAVTPRLLPRTSLIHGDVGGRKKACKVARGRTVVRADPHAVGEAMHEAWKSADVLVQSGVHHMPMATGIGLPCTVQNCGDQVYRSSLDPVLRRETQGISPQAIAFALAMLAYLQAKPGVLVGAVDYYLIAPWSRMRSQKLRPSDLKIGKRIGTGAFGEVYEATVGRGTTDGERVVVKKAKEFGEAETWMNERVERAIPGTCAQFYDSFEVLPNSRKSKRSVFGQSGSREVWLVWKYEGDQTLADFIAKKDFPYNLEERMFGEELDLPRGPERRLETIKAVLKKILEAVARLHAIGIVHRDIKPQNLIVTEEGEVKLIDLGAAADLRVGINYIPREFLLDPRYAAPEKFIMSTQTPVAPPAPVAAFLSPVLWTLNLPDRFDMYSVGAIFFQMCFPFVKTDGNLISFNRQLKSLDYDLEAWRKKSMLRGGRQIAPGFEVLDLDEQSGWKLLKQMMERKPRKRISVAKCLKSDFFAEDKAKEPSLLVEKVDQLLGSVDELASQSLESEMGQFLFDNMAKSGTSKVGGFTEAQLDDLGYTTRKKESGRRRSSTQLWWRERRKAMTEVGEEGLDTVANDLGSALSRVLFRQR